MGQGQLSLRGGAGTSVQILQVIFSPDDSMKKVHSSDGIDEKNKDRRLSPREIGSGIKPSVLIGMSRRGAIGLGERVVEEARNGNEEGELQSNLSYRSEDVKVTEELWSLLKVD